MFRVYFNIHALLNKNIYTTLCQIATWQCLEFRLKTLVNIGPNPLLWSKWLEVISKILPFLAVAKLFKSCRLISHNCNGAYKTLCIHYRTFVWSLWPLAGNTVQCSSSCLHSVKRRQLQLIIALFLWQGDSFSVYVTYF